MSGLCVGADDIRPADGATTKLVMRARAIARMGSSGGAGGGGEEVAERNPCVVEPVMERASCVSTSPILGAHLVSSLFPFTMPVGLYPKSNE